MRKILTKLIRFYQKNISSPFSLVFANPMAGCRFYPSCSEYSIAAINKYGARKGLQKSLIRILKCGPWSDGGINLP